MKSLRHAMSIGLGLAGLTFATVMCIGSTGAANLPRLATLVATVCFVTHTLCVWRVIRRFETALSGSTRRAKTMIDALTDGILVLDADDRIVLASAKVAQWCGRPPFALPGVAASELSWRSADNQRIEKLPWRTGQATGDADGEQWATLADAQGQSQPVRLTARAIIADDGSRQGTLVVLRPAFEAARLPRVGDIAAALRNASTADTDLESLLKLSTELATTCQSVIQQRAATSSHLAPLVVETT
jgi:hypothetical protein